MLSSPAEPVTMVAVDQSLLMMDRRLRTQQLLPCPVTLLTVRKTEYTRRNTRTAVYGLRPNALSSHSTSLADFTPNF